MTTITPVAAPESDVGSFGASRTDATDLVTSSTKSTEDFGLIEAVTSLSQLAQNLFTSYQSSTDELMIANGANARASTDELMIANEADARALDKAISRAAKDVALANKDKEALESALIKCSQEYSAKEIKLLQTLQRERKLLAISEQHNTRYSEYANRLNQELIGKDNRIAKLEQASKDYHFKTMDSKNFFNELAQTSAKNLQWIKELKAESETNNKRVKDTKQMLLETQCSQKELEIEIRSYRTICTEQTASIVELEAKLADQLLNSSDLELKLAREKMRATAAQSQCSCSSQSFDKFTKVMELTKIRAAQSQLVNSLQQTEEALAGQLAARVFIDAELGALREESMQLQADTDKSTTAFEAEALANRAALKNQEEINKKLETQIRKLNSSTANVTEQAATIRTLEASLGLSQEKTAELTVEYNKLYLENTKMNYQVSNLTEKINAIEDTANKMVEVSLENEILQKENITLKTQIQRQCDHAYEFKDDITDKLQKQKLQLARLKADLRRGDEAVKSLQKKLSVSDKYGTECEKQITELQLQLQTSGLSSGLSQSSSLPSSMNKNSKVNHITRTREFPQFPQKKRRYAPTSIKKVDGKDIDDGAKRKPPYLENIPQKVEPVDGYFTENRETLTALDPGTVVWANHSSSKAEWPAIIVNVSTNLSNGIDVHKYQIEYCGKSKGKALLSENSIRPASQAELDRISSSGKPALRKAADDAILRLKSGYSTVNPKQLHLEKQVQTTKSVRQKKSVDKTVEVFEDSNGGTPVWHQATVIRSGSYDDKFDNRTAIVRYNGDINNFSKDCELDMYADERRFLENFSLSSGLQSQKPVSPVSATVDNQKAMLQSSPEMPSERSINCCNHQSGNDGKQGSNRSARNDASITTKEFSGASCIMGVNGDHCSVLEEEVKGSKDISSASAVLVSPIPVETGVSLPRKRQVLETCLSCSPTKLIADEAAVKKLRLAEHIKSTCDNNADFDFSKFYKEHSKIDANNGYIAFNQPGQPEVDTGTKK